MKSPLVRAYLVLGLAAIALYLWAGLSGWEIGTPTRAILPAGPGGPSGPGSADVRRAPGGYRSYHFWHSGYRGGK